MASNRNLYMTAYEAREYLCCSGQTLLGYLRSGHIKARRLNARRNLYDRASVESFWNQSHAGERTTPKKACATIGGKA